MIHTIHLLKICVKSYFAISHVDSHATKYFLYWLNHQSETEPHLWTDVIHELWIPTQSSGKLHGWHDSTVKAFALFGCGRDDHYCEMSFILMNVGYQYLQKFCIHLYVGFAELYWVHNLCCYTIHADILNSLMERNQSLLKFMYTVKHISSWNSTVWNILLIFHCVHSPDI
jgi:hypothetical protein